jgi:antitoxin (DNA-binding transcriptional repressor) of toxin-antitoxin stability system
MTEKMTDITVRSDEARRNLRYLLDQVARDYHVTILRYDKPVAVMVPVDWYEDAEAAWSAQVERDAEGKPALKDAGSRP